MTEKELSLEVLLIEDNPGDAKLVEHHLNASHVDDIVGDVTLRHVDSLTDGLAELDRSTYDILFLDLGLPESTGLSTLKRALQEVSGIPIIVLTGLDDRQTAVQSIQRGAQDYLLKNDIDPDTLARSLRYAVERYRQEEELRRQNERLEKFASVVSHDLRNPLNVAKGRVDLIQDEYESHHLDQVDGAIARMETLVEDLLTLARQGESIDSLEPVSLRSITEESWRNTATGQLDLVIESASAIYANESRLKQLLENLFRNAIDHNDDPVTITVGVDAEGFHVEDDGTGVSKADQDRIFESGYSTSPDGTGFGLMIVEEIVNVHGWDISVTDSDDGGARFDIRGVEFVDD